MTPADECQQRRGNFNLSTATRFLVTGGLSTLLYSALTLGLSTPQIGLPIGIASMIGFVVSLIASYAGHALFTFRIEVGHARAGLRYAVVSLGLAALFSVAAQFLVDRFGIDSSWTTAIAAVGYPFLSYLLHSAWSFDRV